MSVVRPFAETDISQVADLHRRVFLGGAPQAASAAQLQAYRRYFSDVFLNPTLDSGAVGSLVYESRDRILGFLGVMPRRMRFKSKPALMAVCTQFAVDPAGRGQVGLRLLKHCFAGPQDLTVSDEAGDGTRTIWEWCGGETVLPMSMHWIRPLRPAQLAMALLAERASLPRLAGMAASLARPVDALLRTQVPALRPSSPTGSREEFDGSTFPAALAGIAWAPALGPDYDARSAAWAIERAGTRPGHGRVRAFVVRGGDASINGWFAYCISGNRIGEVLQVAARPPAAGQVLDHLLDDAMQQRAVAVSGRLAPSLVAPLSDRQALFYRGNHWMLVHSARPDLRYAVQRGDALLTRLEGEWCLRFP